MTEQYDDEVRVTYDDQGQQVPYLDYQAAQAEATTPPDGSTAVVLCGKTIRILPVGKWKTRAQKALRAGDFDTWAELVLVDGDYEVWEEVDPTNDDVEEMFVEWGKATGQNTGKSRRLRR